MDYMDQTVTCTKCGCETSMLVTKLCHWCTAAEMDAKRKAIEDAKDDITKAIDILTSWANPTHMTFSKHDAAFVLKTVLELKQSRSVGTTVGYVGVDALSHLRTFTDQGEPNSIRLYNQADPERGVTVPLVVTKRSKVKPFGYFHELLNHEGKGNGVFLGSYDKDVTEKSYIEGEVSPVVFALYKE